MFSKINVQSDCHSEIHGLASLFALWYRGNVVKNNKTCSFYVLYTQSDKAQVIDQSEHVQGPISIINGKKNNEHNKMLQSFL